MSASALPTYIHPSNKLPWQQAAFVILPQLPYVRKEVLRKGYRNQPNLLAGFCYASSEALYHLSEDLMLPWVVRYGEKPHQTHWYLTVAETGEIVDLTGSQFGDTDAYAIYEHGRRCGFLTKGPATRARAILDRIDRRHYWRKSARHITFERADKRFSEVDKRKRKTEHSKPKD